MEIKAKVQQIKTSVKVKFLSAIFLDVFPRAKYNYLKAGFKEFDKDLAILLTWFDNPEGKQVPSKAVDEIWHSMILYTQKYGDFCKTHYGKFIHHIPGDKFCHCEAAGNDCEADCGPGGKVKNSFCEAPDCEATCDGGPGCERKV